MPYNYTGPNDPVVMSSANHKNQMKHTKKKKIIDMHDFLKIVLQ